MISPLFFIAYKQTRVPAPSVLGPCAGAAAQVLVHRSQLLNFKELPPVPQVHGPLLNPEIPKFLDP
jgi:hypothetical protein